VRSRLKRGPRAHQHAAQGSQAETPGFSPEEQSETARRLAAIYFSSARLGDHDADTIALGMLAGWDVSHFIADAHFIFASHTFSQQPQDLIGHALIHPYAVKPFSSTREP